MKKVVIGFWAISLAIFPTICWGIGPLAVSVPSYNSKISQPTATTSASIFDKENYISWVLTNIQPSNYATPRKTYACQGAACTQKLRFLMTDKNYENRYMIQTKFDKLDLCNANFHKAILFQSSFRRSNLEGADFSNAILLDANLRQADLTGADLRGTDLTAAQLKGADFTDATYDKHTFFPDGFIPQKEGMIFVPLCRKY